MTTSSTTHQQSSTKSTGIYKQFPVRLDHQLSTELERMSEKTNIPKSTITRIALIKFMNELDDSGVKDAIEKICRK
jgi:predicted DNA-binding protein